jgi:MraZ protein
VASFYGTETHAIDHKGRVSIPAPMRRSVGKKALDTFFVVKGLDGCVALYTPDDFKQVEERLRRLSMWDRKNRRFTRMYLRDAQKVVCDAQGRIMLTSALMNWADLKKEAVIFGHLDRIEIWNPERLDAQMAAGSDTLEEVGAEVFKDEHS